MSTAPLIKPTLPSLPSRLFFLHIRPSPIRTLSQIAVVLWPYLTPFHHTHRCITYAQGLGLLHNSFVSLHFNDAVHPPSRPLPFTWMRACPTPPSTPLRPFHRFILGCNASFSRLTPAHFPQHACTTSLSTRHRSSPAVCTHARRTSLTPLHAVFEAPTALLLSVDRRSLHFVLGGDGETVLLSSTIRRVLWLYPFTSHPRSVGSPCGNL